MATDKPFDAAAWQDESWWKSAVIATGAPPLTAAADLALGITMTAERQRHQQAGEDSTEVSFPVTLPVLIGLALVAAVRWPPPGDRLDELHYRTHNWRNCYGHVEVGPATVLLADDDTARQVAQLRPPTGAGFYMGTQGDAATRPASELGTVPCEVDDDLSQLLAHSDAWTEFRTWGRDILATYHQWAGLGLADEAGTAFHEMRQHRVRRCWLDQYPARPPIVPLGEDGIH
ncbi:hypothetical protein [Saccharopolyspora shandongensis]|uniref:hypothetical protein n=1 Tax=Saccharopolyspora shandongensis TaxID=418495 RepID=UPI0033D72075